MSPSKFLRNLLRSSSFRFMRRKLILLPSTASTGEAGLFSAIISGSFLSSFLLGMGGVDCCLDYSDCSCSYSSSYPYWEWQYRLASTAYLPWNQVRFVSSYRLTAFGLLSLLVIGFSSYLLLIILLVSKRQLERTELDYEFSSIEESRMKLYPFQLLIVALIYLRNSLKSWCCLLLNLRACLNASSGIFLILLASVGAALWMMRRVSRLTIGRWCIRRQLNTQSVPSSSKIQQQVSQSLFLSAFLTRSAVVISGEAINGWSKPCPLSLTISFSLSVFWISLEMMMAYAMISGQLAEIQHLAWLSLCNFMCDSSQISSSCVRILVMDSRLSLGSNYSLHACGSLPSRVAMMKNLSICSQMVITSPELRSLRSSRDTSLIISRMRFHRKSKMCRNYILDSPGGRGKASSRSFTLSASMISFMICVMAFMRPVRERGRSLSSSFSSQSSDLLVDLRYRLRASAQSGYPVFLLISKMAKERPVSSRIIPSSRFRLFVMNVSNRQLNQSLLHMVWICCKLREADDWGVQGTAATFLGGALSDACISLTDYCYSPEPSSIEPPTLYDLSITEPSMA